MNTVLPSSSTTVMFQGHSAMRPPLASPSANIAPAVLIASYRADWTFGRTVPSSSIVTLPFMTRKKYRGIALCALGESTVESLKRICQGFVSDAFKATRLYQMVTISFVSQRGFNVRIGEIYYWSWPRSLP